MEVHHERVQKSLMLIEKFKNVDFEPKNDPFSPFWALKKNPQKSKTLFTACHQVQFEKNLINRFREKLKRVDFEPNNVPFLFTAPSLLCVD